MKDIAVDINCDLIWWILLWLFISNLSAHWWHSFLQCAVYCQQSHLRPSWFSALFTPRALPFDIFWKPHYIRLKAQTVCAKGEQFLHSFLKSSWAHKNKQWWHPEVQKWVPLSGVGSMAMRRFKFTESLIVNQMVQTLHTSANILHVCIHKNVLTIL